MVAMCCMVGAKKHMSEWVVNPLNDVYTDKTQHSCSVLDCLVHYISSCVIMSELYISIDNDLDVKYGIWAQNP